MAYSYNLKDSYYFYLDCYSFSRKYYPNNTFFDFTSKILDPISLDRNKYEMAILEIFWSSSKLSGENTLEPSTGLPNTELYVMTDIVTKEVQVGQSYLPLLRVVTEPTTFREPYYLPLSRDYIDTIRIYIRNPDGLAPDFEVGGMRCTLKIRRKGTK